MLRQFTITVICLCLFGCGSIPGLESHDADKPQVAVQRDEACTTVAEQRTKDAAYNGYDRDMQKRIYEYSYTGCMTGRQKSGH